MAESAPMRSYVGKKRTKVAKLHSATTVLSRYSKKNKTGGTKHSVASKGGSL